MNYGNARDAFSAEVCDVRHVEMPMMRKLIASERSSVVDVSNDLIPPDHDCGLERFSHSM